MKRRGDVEMNPLSRKESHCFSNPFWMFFVANDIPAGIKE